MSVPILAHTGLPSGGIIDGLLHPFLGIDHLLAMVAVGILAAISRDRRAAWLIPIGFVGGMLAGGVGGLLGLELPAVEVMIAISVIALGAAVMAHAHHAAGWLPLVAAVFGAAHGHAHGAELPDGATPALYVVAFVAATAALHLSGAGLGLRLRQTAAARIASGGVVSSAGLVLMLA